MFYQHPLIPLVLLSLTLILLVKQSLNQHKLFKIRLFIVAILVFIASLALFFNNQIEQSNFKTTACYCYLGLDVINAIILFFSFNSSNSHNKYHDFLFSTIDESKIFVLLDKKDRVKEASKLLSSDLSIDFEEMYGKNFFDIIEKKYRIIGINDVECDSNYLKDYFKNSNKLTEISKIDLKLKLLDDDTSYYLLEKNIFGNNNKFKGRILIGDKKNKESLMGIENKLSDTEQELEVIKNRFVTILEKTTEGIYFNDITNGYIWVNDVLVTKLALKGNSLSTDEFLKLIHPDDLPLYKEKISNISKENPEYSTSYRFYTGYNYVFVKETGKKIISGNNVEFCGIMFPIDNYRFERTDTLLDEIQGEPELNARFSMLCKEDRVFLAVRMKLDSIPMINEKYGRSIGNYAMNQYIQFFKDKFVNDNYIYRVSGLEFVCLIVDYQKMDNLNKKLVNGEKILHVEAEYLNDKISTTIYMGLSYSNDSPDHTSTLNNCKEALKFASNKQVNSNFAYYKDIK